MVIAGRMVAARIAVPFLQEVELGKRPKLPKSIKRQSLNEMAAFVAGKPDRASRRMSKAGSGGRALRVIHLARKMVHESVLDAYGKLSHIVLNRTNIGCEGLAAEG
jgi:hypothetical protein